MREEFGCQLDYRHFHREREDDSQVQTA